MPLVSAMFNMSEPASRYTLLSDLAMMDDTARAVSNRRSSNTWTGLRWEVMIEADPHRRVKMPLYTMSRFRLGQRNQYTCK